MYICCLQCMSNLSIFKVIGFDFEVLHWVQNILFSLFFKFLLFFGFLFQLNFLSIFLLLSIYKNRKVKKLNKTRGNLFQYTNIYTFFSLSFKKPLRKTPVEYLSIIMSAYVFVCDNVCYYKYFCLCSWYIILHSGILTTVAK